jgi:large subunit ribosomal protein L3
MYVLRELRATPDQVAAAEVGTVLNVADLFSDGDTIDVTGTSKGCGFAGVMKRYNFAGFIRSHGTHEYFRHGGSIGTRLTPGHVLKGKKMPGQMGNKRVTVQNLQVVRTDAERDLIYIKGGVPGAPGALVLVRKAVKA